MTEAESLEMLNAHASNAMGSFTIYLTLTFAYLTAVYVVGANLSRMQAILISLLYFSWANAFGFSALAHLQSLEALIAQYPQYIYSPLMHLPWSYFGYVILAGGILVCFAFIHATKRQNLLASQGRT
jgi:hypothetical protein